jgi:hypothetical protein
MPAIIRKRMMTLTAQSSCAASCSCPTPRLCPHRSFGLTGQSLPLPSPTWLSTFVVGQPETSHPDTRFLHPPLLACFRCPKCHTPMLRAESLSAWETVTSMSGKSSLTLPNLEPMPLSILESRIPTVFVSLIATVDWESALTHTPKPHSETCPYWLTTQQSLPTPPSSPIQRRTKFESTKQNP